MSHFAYEAINENGNPIKGDIEADSVDAASLILTRRGYVPTKVTKKLGGSSGDADAVPFLERFETIPVSEIVMFTKQFKTLIKAGVPMVHNLTIMEEQTENNKLKRIIAQISKDVKEGKGLHEAFKKHEKTFTSLYVSMIEAGEASGALVEVIERLVYILEHENKVNSDIKSALRYPQIILGFVFVAFLVLLNFVVPTFAKIFKSAKLELPLPTVICIAMSDFMASYWHIMLVGTVVAIISYKKYLKTDQGRYVKDSTVMRLPIVGTLIVKSAMSRFASIFSILQSSGVGVLDSMKILTGTINNAAIEREFENITERLEKGQGISGPLRSAKYFTPMLVNMVAIGEETGNLDEMLKEIAAHYDMEVEYAVAGLAEAIGPLLTVALAQVVGFFALAIFLPMWDLTKTAGM